MSDSWKCPHCGHWIGSMQVHQDCQRKQEEKHFGIPCTEEEARKAIGLPPAKQEGQPK
jgi:adenine-specific DNA methylase